MKDLLIVFFGGGLGSVIRFSMGRWVNTMHAQRFPWGTLAVNIAACLALGFVIGLADHKQLISPSWRLFWTVGFCGGFSTFSTFSQETMYLLQSGLTTTVVIYVFMSVVLCLGAVYAGLYLGESNF